VTAAVKLAAAAEWADRVTAAVKLAAAAEWVDRVTAAAVWADKVTVCTCCARPACGQQAWGSGGGLVDRMVAGESIGWQDWDSVAGLQERPLSASMLMITAGNVKPDPICNLSFCPVFVFSSNVMDLEPGRPTVKYC
jgi:hypothetical protein